MSTKKLPGEIGNQFVCERCDYICFDRSNFNKHKNTLKHIKKHMDNERITDHNFSCKCGKAYRFASGLSKHRNKCTMAFEQASEIEDKSMINTDVFVKILEDNKELRHLLCHQQEQMKEQQQLIKEQQERHHKEITELIPKVGNTTNNNQSFNLQFFLNEQCKDAISWEDFMKSLEVGADEFNAMTDSDLTEGVVKVICHGIQDLGVYKRPIHCVDAKRKKICIRENTSWNHDEDTVLGALHQANIAMREKYNKVMIQWEKTHPNWSESETETETYMRLLEKMMGTLDEKKCTTEIAKNTIIPKDAE
jgi:hypothetical protein